MLATDVYITPGFVAADGFGNVYFTSSNSVYKIYRSGAFANVAGYRNISGYSGDGGPGTDAMVKDPQGIAADSAGNVYIADLLNTAIRRVDIDGIITTVFAGPTLGRPWDLALDRLGNLYYTDRDKNTINKVTPGGVTAIAGNGIAGFGGDGGPAVSARLNIPEGIAIDAAGNIYFADSNNYRIRRISTDGMITTIAGTGVSGYSGDGGLATLARIGNVPGVAVDAAGNVYIADTDAARIRKISPNGMITTFAGAGGTGISGDGGLALQANLGNLSTLALDPAGNLYLVSSWQIRKIDTHGIITTIGGTGSAVKTPVPGSLALSAQVGSFLSGIAVDTNSRGIFVADSNSSQVTRIAPDGTLDNFAGNGNTGFCCDAGPAATAWLNRPSGITFDSIGNLYIADSANARIRKVTPSGTIMTVAGGGNFGFAGDGGPATLATLADPESVAFDQIGNVYIADTGNYRVRKISAASGMITTMAGNGVSGVSTGDDNPATEASLERPTSVAVDAFGNVYIVEAYRIRRVATNGIITTVAGNGSFTVLPTGDGGPATSAPLSDPRDVAVDQAGNLYIAEDFDIRIVSPTGIINTVAGGAYNCPGSLPDGLPATNACVMVQRLALDTKGNIYFTDRGPAVRVLIPVGTKPVLMATLNHTRSLVASQSAASYAIQVRNAFSAAPTSGPVSVNEILPDGLSLVSMSGVGWSCSGTACTRSDTLQPGAGYPPITVVVSVATNPAPQVVNRVTVTGGGAFPTLADDATNILGLGLGPYTYAISGRILNAQGVASGVSVKLTGSQNATTITDALGVYAFADLAASGNYVITPSASGSVFTPASRTFNNLSTAQTGDFILQPPKPMNVGVFRKGDWHLDLSGTAQWTPATDLAGNFGAPGDIPVLGDWDGSGTMKVGVFRNGEWHLDLSGTGQWSPATDRVGNFGLPGDIPVVGDWDGSGKTKVGVFRNGEWHLDMSGTAQWNPATELVGRFGGTGDIPVVGDWDGSGKTKVGVFRNGDWHLDLSGTATWAPATDLTGNFGAAGDIPVVGDWDGSGRTKVGVFRKGEWHLDLSGTARWSPATDLAGSFGVAGDVPVVGIWDASRKTKIGVFRNGMWVLDLNGNLQWDGSAIDRVGSFGAAGDIPVVGAWR